MTSTDPHIKEAVERLSEDQPGHWSTAAGLAMAQDYAKLTRADLGSADLTDFALANEQYMAGRMDLNLVPLQTAAKERIRWLSVQLALAESALSASNARVKALEEALERIATYGGDYTTGDGHAKCREIARSTLSEAPGHE